MDESNNKGKMPVAASDNESIIKVKNVKKVYRMGSERIYAVDDVSFDINNGRN